jgi:hypothetical protein
VVFDVVVVSAVLVVASGSMGLGLFVEEVEWASLVSGSEDSNFNEVDRNGRIGSTVVGPFPVSTSIKAESMNPNEVSASPAEDDKASNCCLAE